MGEFSERLAELRHRVGGPGPIELSNTVDQVYAFNVHEGYWLNFMGRYGPKNLQVHSGEAHFLTNALFEGSARFMQRQAQELYDLGTRRPMSENAIDLVKETARRTPVEFGDLSESGHAQVTEDGAVVFDQPPIVPRLSRGVLAQKSRQLRAGDMRRHYLPRGHPHRSTIHPRNRAGHPRHKASRRAAFEL